MIDNKAKNYLEMKVKTASPLQLIIMLYDKAILLLNSAIVLLEKKSLKYDEVNNSIIKAQDIVSELMIVLDFEKGGEIAQNLFAIYDYCIKKMIDGNIQKNADELKIVVKILTDLRISWSEIEKKDVSQKTPAKNESGSSFNRSV